MTFPQLGIIVNDYAWVFNRFNVSRLRVAKPLAGHVPSIRIGWVTGHDTWVLFVIKMQDFQKNFLESF